MWRWLSGVAVRLVGCIEMSGGAIIDKATSRLGATPSATLVKRIDPVKVPSDRLLAVAFKLTTMVVPAPGESVPLVSEISTQGTLASATQLNEALPPLVRV